MTLSERDKKILIFLIPVVVVFGYWFLLLAPKREAAATAETTLQSEQATLAEAEANANTVNAAKANFARDYAAVVALGKAIPTSVDMPSLLV
jgi:type II secretory pathway component PulM